MVRPFAPALGRRPALDGTWADGWRLCCSRSDSRLTRNSRQLQPLRAAGRAARVFASDAGMVLNFIKPDKTADFEAVMGKLKEALQKSDKPERKQQAASWKVFKSADPAGANVLYVFVDRPGRQGRRLHGVEHPRRRRFRSRSAGDSTSSTPRPMRSGRTSSTLTRADLGK